MAALPCIDMCDPLHDMSLFPASPYAGRQNVHHGPGERFAGWLRRWWYWILGIAGVEIDASEAHAGSNFQRTPEMIGSTTVLHPTASR